MRVRLSNRSHEVCANLSDLLVVHRFAKARWGCILERRGGCVVLGSFPAVVLDCTFLWLHDVPDGISAHVHQLWYIIDTYELPLGCYGLLVIMVLH